MTDPTPAAAGATRPFQAPPDDLGFFGHPRGLSTLFFTEMWERFSYYGMRALLLLYMTAPVAAGGLGFDTARGGAIYGLYTSMVYMTTLPGGWIADRLIGPRRAVLYGGILIASGHFCMAFPSLSTFYLGLFLIVIGTGLLKGNVSVIVGQLYAPTDVRRDAGFSIFYMGINLGAFVSPLVCGYLGQRVDWHLGFAAAGVGMVIGIVQYLAGARSLGEAGLHPAPAASPEAAVRLRRTATRWAIAGSVVLVAAGAAAFAGVLPVTATQVSDAAGVFLLVLTIGVLRLAVLRRRLDAGRAPPALCHRGPLSGRVAVLGGLRAGRLDAQPVRRSRHPQRRAGLHVSEQLVSSRSTRSSSSRWRPSSRGCGCGWRRRAASRRARPSSPSGCCLSAPGSRF